MAQATFHFPRGFLWGTATAVAPGRGQEYQQQLVGVGAASRGISCRGTSRGWRAIGGAGAGARISTGQQTAVRTPTGLSIEWSRVQPAPNRWDEDALDRYRQMLRGLRERDMTPMVTLHHFSDPLWLEEQGGWENPDVVEIF